MRRVLVLFAFAVAGPACGSAAVSVPASAPSPSPSSQVVVSPQAQRASSPSPGESVRGCQATPSTVYGDEAVVFEIDAAATPKPVEVELFDQQGHSRAKAALKLPGQWRPPPLPSGDFRLQAGSSRVTCWVTVNRELARGRAAAQK